MNYTYGYVDDSDEIKGSCICGFKFENLLETNIQKEFTTKCPSCDRAVKIRVLDLIVDLRGLKVIKNKLEKRCVALIIDMAVYQIHNNYIEIFPDNINVSITEKSFNNFELCFNNTLKFFVYIDFLDIIREYNKFNTDFIITSESDFSFNLKINDSIYY